MLPATQAEIDHVTSYMEWQAPDLAVKMVQKVYAENVLHVRHDVWDVHTNVDRWWVITEPMNLYSQGQFPNMDLALTFHVGLCLRIPRNDRQKLSALPIELDSVNYDGHPESRFQSKTSLNRRRNPIGRRLRANAFFRPCPLCVWSDPETLRTKQRC
jgi:hypothetical protein